MELLTPIAEIAARAHAPFLAGAEVSADGFEGPEYTAWNAFRDRGESRYVALTLPRILLREPFGHRGTPGPGPQFIEWMGEAVLSERQELDLSRLGFVPLAADLETGSPVFFSVPSTHRSFRYEGSAREAAPAEASRSDQLSYVFARARFVHYLNAIMRDRSGSYRTPEELGALLDSRLRDYLLLTDGASEEEKAGKPLRSGEVAVVEDRGSPGRYLALISLRAHFQLDPEEVRLHIVVEVPDPLLPAPAQGRDMSETEPHSSDAKAGLQRLLRDAVDLSGPWAEVVGENLIQFTGFVCTNDVDWLLAELRNPEHPLENRILVAGYLGHPHRESMLMELKRERAGS